MGQLHRLVFSLLLISLAPAPCHAQTDPTVRSPKGDDVFETYTLAATRFLQGGWIGTSKGDAERITVSILSRSSRMTLELSPDAPPNAVETVKALLEKQGWDRGRVRQTSEGHGRILSVRLDGIPRSRGWNRNVVRLDLDRLVGGLRELGGNPAFLAVRTAKELELTATPPPLAGGEWEDSRWSFYRLRASGNGSLTLQYGMPPRPAAAALASMLMWLLFPAMAAIAVRLWYRPQPEANAGAERKRWKKIVTFLRHATAVGAYVTLYFQTDTMRLIWLPINGIADAFGRLSFWVIPFCFFLHGWAGAAWSLVGPSTSESRVKSVLLALGAGVAFLAIYMALYLSTTYGITIRDPFWALRWFVGGVLIIVAGILLLSWWRSEQRRRDGKAAELADGPIPESDDDRRRMLERIAARLATPEEQARMETRLKQLPANYAAMAEVSRQLSFEEKSWMVLSDRLSLQDNPSPGDKFQRQFLWVSLGIGASGVVCFFVPSLVTIVIVVAAMAGMGLFFKRMKREAMAYTASCSGDIAVARLLDDPRRFVAVFRRFEAVEQEEGGPKTEFSATRRRKLEEFLLDQELGQPTKGASEPR